MEPKNIADITLKDIFVKMLGEENANKFLISVQNEYEKGISGDDLVNYAEKEIMNYTPTTRMFLPAAAAAAAIIIFHVPLTQE